MVAHGIVSISAGSAETQSFVEYTDGVVAMCLCSRQIGTQVATLLINGIIPTEEPDNVERKSLNLVLVWMWVISFKVSLSQQLQSL